MKEGQAAKAVARLMHFLALFLETPLLVLLVYVDGSDMHEGL